MKEFQEPMGKVIRKARLEQGLTQFDVARRLGLDSRTILNIENGKGNPKAEVLYPLIRLLKIDPREIFYPDKPDGNAAYRKMEMFLASCSEEELEALLPMCRYFIDALRAKSNIPVDNE